jgi:hypothetical protein
MPKSREGLALGVGAAALVAAKFGVKAIVFAGAYFASRTAVAATVEFFNTPAEAKEMKVGFQEVSMDWDAFLKAWADSSSSTFTKWGQRIAASYTTEDEIIEIYAYRGRTFVEMAEDTLRSPVCSIPATLPAASIDLGPLPRIAGRGFARRHAGRQAWVPPVDLAVDEDAWVAFAEYLVAHDMRDVGEAVLDAANEIPVPAARACRAQGRLYSYAASHPQDRVGQVRLLDFVRSLDVLGGSS